VVAVTPVGAPRERGAMKSHVLKKTEIHPTAVIHPWARIGEGVKIGPYTVIGENVEIGDECEIARAFVGGLLACGEARNQCPTRPRAQQSPKAKATLKSAFYPRSHQ